MSDEDNFSKVKFNHELAEKEQVRKKYKPGWHQVVVTSAARQMSKTGDKNPDMAGVYYKMLVTNLKPIRDENDVTSVVGKGINVYQCLPFWDESWDEIDREVDSADGPMHIKKVLERNMLIYRDSVRDELAALIPDEVPARPSKIGEQPYSYKGVEIDKDQYKECNTESNAAAGEVAERLWNDGPTELVDKACFVLLAYDEKSKYPNSPNVKAWSATAPVDRKTGEPLEVLHGEMVGGDGEDEVEASAEEKPAKTNGAKGKPTATKATVAQAAANKKAAVKGKGARR